MIISVELPDNFSQLTPSQVFQIVKVAIEKQSQSSPQTSLQASEVNSGSNLNSLTPSPITEEATASIEEQKRNLEKEVAQRTQELRSANHSLKQSLKEVKSMQNKLILQEKLASLGGITSGIAHEIKNPLNFITNYAILAEEMIADYRGQLDIEKDKYDEMAWEVCDEFCTSLKQITQIISKNGHRIERIINSMLFHSGGTASKRELTEINELLNEYVNLSYHGIRAQKMSFHPVVKKEFDPLMGMNYVIPQDLGRVFLNLLSNSLYALAEKEKRSPSDFIPTLLVTTKKLPDILQIVIRDNGPGIPQDTQSKVFDPFFTTKPTGEGTGLGLYICYEIVVQKHQGQLKLNSEEGQFTEVTILLPHKKAT